MKTQSVHSPIEWACLNHDLLQKHSLSELEGQNIIRILNKPPTIAEIGVFSVMWSEHCSYKTSKKYLAKLPTEGEDVVIGPGENAGVVRIYGDLVVVFKMESHNHPSYIDPVQGAATGVGGILRDVFCMGARPIAVTNALRFGSTCFSKTPWLTHGVVQGISSYGNCVGVANIGGSIRFDAGFNGNILVNAGAIGIARESQIFLGEAKNLGDEIYYVGSPTGRDGIHGAVMASDSFDDQDSSGDRSAVQVGDPYYEKLLIEVTLEALRLGIVSGLQDMGAAGLTSSLMEMAERGEMGIRLDLEQVPTRSEGLTAYELLLSETQERMAMAVNPADASKLRALCSDWGLECAKIGEVTATNRFQAYYQGNLEVDIPIRVLNEYAPKVDLPASGYPRPSFMEISDGEDRLRLKLGDLDLKQALLKCFQTKVNISPIYENYDRHIGTMSVLGPEHGGVSVMDLSNSSSDFSVGLPEGLGLAYGEASLDAQCNLAPYLGGAHAVVKVFRVLATAGAKPLGLTDCLNFGSPKNPDVLGAFSEVIDGMAASCRALNFPVVSGNVSLYNSTGDNHIPHTPMLGGVGRVMDVRACCPARLMNSEDATLFVLRPKKAKPSLLGTSLALTNGFDEPHLLSQPDYQNELFAAQIVGHLLASEAPLFALKDLSFSGLLVSVIQMVLGQEVCLSRERGLNLDDFCWFPASYLVVVESGFVDHLQGVIPDDLCDVFTFEKYADVVKTSDESEAQVSFGQTSVSFSTIFSSHIQPLS